MLPIAVLPMAGLLLRLGQPDLLDIAFVAAAGNAIFANLGLIFAIGVAVGIARENHGAAGLAGAVGYLIVTEGAKALLAVPPEITAPFADQAARDLAAAAWRSRELAKLSVPAGILAGLTAGWLYNRYANIKLPEYLAFFGGRRFVPIAAGLAGVVGALVFGLGFPWLEQGIDTLSRGRGRRGPARPVRLRGAQPAADRHRAPPHPQQYRLVHPRRLSRRERRSATASSPAIPRRAASCPASSR